MKSADALQFNFPSIRAATNNFSEANKLGRGGFGAVYRVRNRSFMKTISIMCLKNKIMFKFPLCRVYLSMIRM